MFETCGTSRELKAEGSHAGENENAAKKKLNKHLLVISAIKVSALNYVKLLCQHLEEKGCEFSSKQHQ